MNVLKEVFLEKINRKSMTRAFQIMAIVFSLILLIIVVKYAQDVSIARVMPYYNSLGAYNSYSNYSGSSYSELTSQAAIICTLFVLFFTTVQILSLLRIKTKTMKVLSIIGLSLSGILLLFGLMVMSSPGAITFDESGGFWAIYSLIILAFSIVGTIHAFKTKS